MDANTLKKIIVIKIPEINLFNMYWKLIYKKRLDVFKG